MNFFRKNKDNAPAGSEGTNNKAAASNSASLSLNDDRRVKALSPGTMVAKRFFRNKLAVAGLVILVAMFLNAVIAAQVLPVVFPVKESCVASAQ